MPPSLLGSIIKNDAGMPPSLLGSFGSSFRRAKNVFGFSNSNKILSCAFRRHLEAGCGGWDLDVAVFHLPFWKTRQYLCASKLLSCLSVTTISCHRNVIVQKT